LLESAFAIGIDLGRTIYDGIYVALAVMSGRTLLTADERLANAVATRFPIRWLGAMAG
jgi:predicted nucleic acid-binding protein